MLPMGSTSGPRFPASPKVGVKLKCGSKPLALQLAHIKFVLETTDSTMVVAIFQQRILLFPGNGKFVVVGEIPGIR